MYRRCGLQGAPADDDRMVQPLQLGRALFVVVDAGLVEAEVLALPQITASAGL